MLASDRLVEDVAYERYTPTKAVRLAGFDLVAPMPGKAWSGFPLRPHHTCSVLPVRHGYRR